MSWRGILRKAGLTSDGSNVDVAGIIRASNMVTTRGVITYIHSGIGNDSSGAGKRPQSPFASIEYAVNNRTVASRGDHIICLPGHTESVIAAGGLDLDIAGLYIWFLGEGSNKAKISFGTDVGADMDIDAANITLMWPLFVSAIDALTGPIDINASDFTIVGGEYRDAAAKAATDCIVATAAATRLNILGWKYRESTTGTQKQSNIQLNGVDNATLEDIDIVGDFETGIIENVTDEALDLRLRNLFLNNTDAAPTPCIVLDSAASGHAKNVHCRVASGTTYVSDVADLNWASDCLGYSTDGYGGEPIGTPVGSGLEGKIDTIDGYHDVATADAVDNAVISDVTGNKEDAAAAGAVSTVETLMAYAKQNVGLAIARDLAIATQGRRTVEKLDGAVLSGLDPLFTVTGFVRCKIVGHVTTIVGGAANLRLQHITTDPAATVELSAGAVAVDNDAVGTVYHNLGATSVFTPSGGLGFVLLDPVTVEETEFLLADGVIQCLGSAAQSGVISWYISYEPLGENSSIVAL